LYIAGCTNCSEKCTYYFAHVRDEVKNAPKRLRYYNCKTIWVLETAGVCKIDDKGLAMYYRQGYVLHSHASTLYFKLAFALY
jgi:hypothetical protein